MEQVHLECFAVLKHRCYMLDTFLETRDQEHVSVDKIGMQHDANELQQNTNPLDECSNKTSIALLQLSQKLITTQKVSPVPHRVEHNVLLQ